MFKSLNTGAIGVRADLAQSVSYAAQFGFQGVHVNIQEVAALGVGRARDLLQAADIRASAFGLPFDYRIAEADLAAAVGRLREQSEVARVLGMTRAFTWVPSWHDELDFDANYAFLRDRFGRIAAVLSDHGIRLALEFLGPKTLRDGHRYVFIHTMGAMLEFAAEIGTGNIGLLLDAYHWYTAHGTLAEIRKLRDADVVDVHVNDAPAGIPPDEQIDQIRTLPGETGVIGVPGFLKALAEIGYTGPVMVEPFSKRVNALPPEEAVRVTAQALDSVWREAGL